MQLTYRKLVPNFFQFTDQTEDSTKIIKRLYRENQKTRNIANQQAREVKELKNKLSSTIIKMETITRDRDKLFRENTWLRQDCKVNELLGIEDAETLIN